MPYYIANMKIDNIDGRVIANRQMVELTEEKALPYVRSGSLEEISGGTDSGDPTSIPSDFPHYADLTKEEEGSPSFRTLEDLRNATNAEIESKRGIGVASRKEIRDALDSDKYS